MEMYTASNSSACTYKHTYSDTKMSFSAPKRRRPNPKLHTINIVEQPKLVGGSFVRHPVSPSLSSYLVGERTSDQKETYPSVLLSNFRGTVKIVWYLVADDVTYPHPYILEGEGCAGGVCTRTIKAEGQIISFQEFFVRRVSRKDMESKLLERLDLLKQILPGENFKLKGLKEYDLSTVRICFQALSQDAAHEYKEILKPVMTRLIHNRDPLMLTEPRILSISECKGTVRGKTELSLQVANLKTEDIWVFFHYENLHPRISWQAFAEILCISPINIQPVTILIHTPPFYNNRVTQPQTVDIQLRLMNNSFSNSVKYTYTPATKGASRIEHRVKQKEPFFVEYFTSLGATANIDPLMPTSRLQHKDDGNSGLNSKETKRTPLFVFKQDKQQPKKLRAERTTDPRKSTVWSQPRERSWESSVLVGYDSEEEISEGDGRVDIDHLQRYRSLMMPDVAHEHVGKDDSSVSNGLPSHESNTVSDREAEMSGVASCSSDRSTVKENVVKLLSHLELQSSSIEVHNNSSSLSGINTSCGTESCKPKFKMEVTSNDSNKPQAVDAFVPSLNSSADYQEGLSKIPFFTENDVVPEPSGASNHPDVSTSQLLPAIFNKTLLVAIKNIPKPQFNEEACCTWFSLKHESLITVLGMVSKDRIINLVLEFPENGSFKEWLSTRARPATWDMCLKWTQQLAEGLKCLHENGLAHNKVCSENCLIFSSMNLKLSIPSTLVKAELNGHVSNLNSVSGVGFEKAQSNDINSFGMVGWELYNNSEAGDMSKWKFVALMEACSHAVESERPTMYKVVKKLQELTSSIGKLTTITIDRVDETNSGDSGMCLSPRSTESRNISVLNVSEQVDSCGSGESKFSDSLEEERGTSIVLNDSYHGGSKAAKKTISPKSVNTTNSHQEAQENTESGRSENQNESASDDEASKDGNREDGDHNDRFNNDPGEDHAFGCQFRPPREKKRIDHRGGKIVLSKCDISLEIPPGALSEGQEEEITLTVDWNDEHMPQLESTDVNVAPIVTCSPTGLKFLKPVRLQIPHCAVLPHPDKCNATVHCSQTDEGAGKSPDWKRLQKDDSTDVRVECHSRYFLLHTTHFTAFTVTLESGEETQAKEIMFVPYGKDVCSFSEDQDIRLYLYDFYCGHEEKIEQMEKKIGGKLLDTPCPYQVIWLKKGSVDIEMTCNTVGWTLTSYNRETKSFQSIWNIRSWNRCKFTWVNSGENVKFKCTIEAKQQHNEEEPLLLEISNPLKISPDESGIQNINSANHISKQRAPSGPVDLHRRDSFPIVEEPGSVNDSVDSGIQQPKGTVVHNIFANIFQGLQQHPQYTVQDRHPQYTVQDRIIPHKLGLSLRSLLDQRHPLENDWANLAAELNYDGLIMEWKSKQAHCSDFSPTEKLLQLIEQEKKVKSLDELKKLFLRMERHDAADEVAKHLLRGQSNKTPLNLALQEAPTEDPMNTDNTPSPQDVNQPLTTRQLFPSMAEPSTDYGVAGPHPPVSTSQVNLQSMGSDGVPDDATPSRNTDPDSNNARRNLFDSNQNIGKLETGLSKLNVSNDECLLDN